MKIKKFVIIIAGLLTLSYVVWASDYLGPQGQFGAGSAVKNIAASRWSLARVATTTTSLTSITNTTLAFPGIVRKIVFVPGSTNDVIELHNASSITTATAANETFRQANINQTVGLPLVYDLSEGWDHSTGITTVISPGSTAAVCRVYISYDKNQ